MPKHTTSFVSRATHHGVSNGVSRVRASLISAIWLAAASAPAIAQQTQSLKPPAPRQDPSAPVVLTVLVMVLLAGATLFIAVFPSKRGHQD